MPGSIQSVERAAAILHLVADYPGQLKLADVALNLDLAKTTALGLLQTLCEVGFLDQRPDGCYALGEGIQRLSGEWLDPNELRSHAVNWADSLAGRTGEAVRVATLQKGAAILIHHVFRPDDSEQQMEVGEQVPIHATAVGKVLLAWSPLLGARRNNSFDSYTPRTVTSSREIARAMVAVREQGWAGEIEEHRTGIASVAAPIRTTGARVVGAIGIVGAVERLCTDGGQIRSGLRGMVTSAAASVSRDLQTARR